MAHARTQIRNAVVAALTGLSTTGARVHASRMRPTDALPALLITTDAEVIEQGAQRRQMRTMDIVVRGLAKGGDGVDDTLDQIALEVGENHAAPLPIAAHARMATSSGRPPAAMMASAAA